MADTETSLTSSIINTLLSNSKYSSLSKITITNYGSGSTNKIPIGYTDSGVPIYDTGEAALNDDLKDAIAKKHLRNTDTILKGPGTNSIENTSSGNIINFISQGLIKAVIDSEGFFTGKIKLENISDLDNLSIDTSNFFTKNETSILLDAKVSKKDLYTSDAKIDSTLIDVDITRTADFDTHKADMVSHITSNERTNWNSKYFKPVNGIPLTDLNKTVSDKIQNSALNSDLLTHVGDTVAHVTADQKAKWNAKFDLPVTGIPESILETAVQKILDGAAMQSDLNAHEADTVAHITNVERTTWNNKYLKPGSGIPLNDLETTVQNTINHAAPQASLDAHTSNSDIHILPSERLGWNAKYIKPDTGIPETDLESALKSKIDLALPTSDFTAHTSNGTVHITADERTAWNAHKADTVIHISSSERDKWNAKFDLPATGLIETMLSASLQTKINSYAKETDFNQHITDTVAHITESERDSWNGKYVKPSTGIPKTDLSKELSDKIDGSVTLVAYNDHISDTVAHCTSSEKALWNSKYVKPSTGIPLADLASDVTSGISTIVASGIASVESELDGHETNTEIHVTKDNKTDWNSKYVKPSTGIPLADLASDVMVGVQSVIDSSINPIGTSLNNHTSNGDIHITSLERAAWNAKYLKPENGIPLADLASDVTDDMDSKVSTASDALNTSLTTHTSNTTVHITSDERTNWNAKYVKPSTGIPLADLASDVTDDINDSINTALQPVNTSLDTKYVKPETGIPLADLASDVMTNVDTKISTALQPVNTSLDAKYVKPENGIDEVDLSANVVSKLNKVEFFTVEVSEATKTVTVNTTDSHALHTNQFEYSIFAYQLSEDSTNYTLIQPSSVVIANSANGDITVTFTEDFKGQILVR